MGTLMWSLVIVPLFCSPVSGLPCLNGGTYDGIKCRCPEGYKGSQCEEAPVRPGLPCLNGGTYDGIKCVCPEDYFGIHCEDALVRRSM
ncbi:wnt inhibitory factor 1-like [Rana temporaria]|uniref:wnt inhibitory factor 1-like n=1 Tax=Rana temporaria TaxID=8407 RepID=UPI001AAD365C|nr:wnt inhibitory factor 1-like [Rana temporaria]